MIKFSELNDTDSIIVAEKNMPISICILVSDYKEERKQTGNKDKERFSLWKPEKAKIKLSLLDYFKRIEPTVQYGLWAENLLQTIGKEKVDEINIELQKAYEKCPFLYKGEQITID